MCTFEYLLLIGFLQHWRHDAIPPLQQGVSDPRDVVAGYCIVGLGILGMQVPLSDVIHRTGSIKWRFGRRASTSTLREFVEFSYDPDWRARAEPVVTAVDAEGWTTCPRCRFRFKIADRGAFTGGIHLRCSQSVTFELL